VNKKVKMPLLHISPLSFSLGFFCSFFPFFLLVLLHPFPILQLPFVARSLLVLESVANLHFDEMRSCCSIITMLKVFQIQHIFRALNVHMFPGPGIRKLCDSTFLPIIPFHSRAPQCLFNHSRPINSSAAFRAP